MMGLFIDFFEELRFVQRSKFCVNVLLKGDLPGGHDVIPLGRGKMFPSQQMSRLKDIVLKISGQDSFSSLCHPFGKIERFLQKREEKPQ
jgi:hypothetical protein